MLFTFESEATGSNYIVYSDNNIDEAGNTRVFASIYNPDEDKTELIPMETGKECALLK